MAAPEEISVDAAIASVKSELGSISSLEEEQRRALKARLCVIACEWSQSKPY